MDAAAPGDLQKKSSGGLIWGCLGCISLPIIIVLIVVIVGANRGPSEYDANNKYEAIAQCEERVKALLKSPATAEFNTSASGSGTWTVTGTVDSENGFGAMLRSEFQCTVQISGSTATTSVDYLE